MFATRVAVTAVLLSGSVLSKPGQPSRNDAPLGQFEIVGDSIVSAQQLFLGTNDKVYIVDKAEANPTMINGHPAWAAEYSLTKNKGRAMDITTNSFCAGGGVLGNGTWMNVGGNQAVVPGGDDATDGIGGVFHDPDGRNSIRLINPCDDESCEWSMTTPMTTQRWYPTLETLDDGSIIIMGGCKFGGYVNEAGQDNPTWEIFPSNGKAELVHSNILATTLPANLYPLMWLLPSGKLFVQSNWKTVLLDYHTKQETPLDDMIDAVRVYPASGGTVMLPLTPENNYTATMLFCGGSNLQPNQWVKNWNITDFKASDSCVTITPDVSPSYTRDDPLPEGRSMSNLIYLPTGKIICLGGALSGTAGYGKEAWALDESYATSPVLQPVMYDPTAPKGSKWSRDGLSASTVPRMYHSSNTLLPDGSIFVTGSNPHADYDDKARYPTEYRVERFYPSYYNDRRPDPEGLPSSLSYGGALFNVTLSKEDLGGDMKWLEDTKVVVIRTGFSTHAMNMGQRYLQLDSSYTSMSDGTAVLHVRPLPPNPSIFPPGPALLFVVVKGVPSMGVQVMVGSGKIEKQDVAAVAQLPQSNIGSGGKSPQSHGDGNGNGDSSAARGLAQPLPAILTLLAGFWALVFGF